MSSVVGFFDTTLSDYWVLRGAAVTPRDESYWCYFLVSMCAVNFLSGSFPSSASKPGREGLDSITTLFRTFVLFLVGRPWDLSSFEGLSLKTIMRLIVSFSSGKPLASSIDVTTMSASSCSIDSLEALVLFRSVLRCCSSFASSSVSLRLILSGVPLMGWRAVSGSTLVCSSSSEICSFKLLYWEMYCYSSCWEM